MDIHEYYSHVDSKMEVDYGRWIKFKDFFPPVNPEKPYEGTLIEILFQGIPSFHSVFMDENLNVRFRDPDLTNELLEWQMPEALESYWRFIPSPPDNESYDVG